MVLPKWILTIVALAFRSAIYSTSIKQTRRHYLTPLVILLHLDFVLFPFSATHAFSISSIPTTLHENFEFFFQRRQVQSYVDNDQVQGWITMIHLNPYPNHLVGSVIKGGYCHVPVRNP